MCQHEKTGGRVTPTPTAGPGWGLGATALAVMPLGGLRRKAVCVSAERRRVAQGSAHRAPSGHALGNTDERTFFNPSRLPWIPPFHTVLPSQYEEDNIPD